MTLVWIGCALLVPGLILGWWVLALGLFLMLVGLLFSHRPPQDDLVWRMLISDGVIDETGERPDP